MAETKAQKEEIKRQMIARRALAGETAEEAPAEAAPEAPREDILDAARRVGINVQTAPPPPPPADKRSANQKWRDAQGARRFDDHVKGAVKARSEDQERATEGELYSTEMANWERREAERRALIEREFAAGRDPYSDAAKRAMAASPFYAFTGQARPPDPAEFVPPPEPPRWAMVEPNQYAQGATNVPMPSQTMAQRIGVNVKPIPGSKEDRVRQIRDAVREAKIGDELFGGSGLKRLPEDPADKFGPWSWTAGTRRASSQKRRGEKTPAPEQRLPGGDRRPMDDLDRQISDAEARGAETQNRISQNLGLQGTEGQAARFGAASLDPARGSKSQAGVRIVQPSALGAGDDAPVENMTEQQIRMRSDGRHVAAPMGAADGSSKWGTRAIPEQDWADLHSVDPVTQERYRRVMAFSGNDSPELAATFGIGPDGKADQTTVLSRLADKLGIPNDIPQGERIAEAKVYYDEQSKLRQTHDVVNLPTGGAMYRPNEETQARYDTRRALKDANEFLHANPYNNDPSQGPTRGHGAQLRQLIRDGDMEGAARLKAEIRENNSDARSAAHRDRLRHMGNTQNLRNPALAPSMFQETMRTAFASGDPFQIAAARASYGDLAGADRSMGLDLARQQLEADTQQAAMLAESGVAQAQIAGDVNRRNSQSAIDSANESFQGFWSRVKGGGSTGAGAMLDEWRRLREATNPNETAAASAEAFAFQALGDQEIGLLLQEPAYGNLKLAVFDAVNRAVTPNLIGQMTEQRFADQAREKFGLFPDDPLYGPLWEYVKSRRVRPENAPGQKQPDLTGDQKAAAWTGSAQ